MSGVGGTSLIIGGSVAAAVILVLIVLVAGILYRYRDIANTVLRDYKLRHPDRYGSQPDDGPWLRGLFRRHKKVDKFSKAQVAGVPLETVVQMSLRSEMRELDEAVVAKAGKRGDGHVFIPLRDEAFGTTYAEEQREQDKRMLAT